VESDHLEDHDEDEKERDVRNAVRMGYGWNWLRY
jgi:hypothetical protein